MTQVTPKLNNFFITLHTSESWQHFHFFLLILPQISFYYNLKERSIVAKAADTVVIQMIEVIAQVLFTNHCSHFIHRVNQGSQGQKLEQTASIDKTYYRSDGKTKSLQEILVRWCLFRTNAFTESVCSNLTS